MDYFKKEKEVLFKEIREFYVYLSVCAYKLAMVGPDGVVAHETYGFCKHCDAFRIHFGTENNVPREDFSYILAAPDMAEEYLNTGFGLRDFNNFVGENTVTLANFFKNPEAYKDYKILRFNWMNNTICGTNGEWLPHLVTSSNPYMYGNEKYDLDKMLDFVEKSHGKYVATTPITPIPYYDQDEDGATEFLNIAVFAETEVEDFRNKTLLSLPPNELFPSKNFLLEGKA